MGEEIPFSVPAPDFNKIEFINLERGEGPRMSSKIVDLGVDKLTKPEQTVLFDVDGEPVEHIVNLLAWQYYRPQAPESRVCIHTEDPDVTEVYIAIAGRANVHTKIPGYPDSERVKTIKGPLTFDEAKRAQYQLLVEEGKLILQVQVGDEVKTLSPDIIIPPNVEHATVADPEEGCLFLALKLENRSLSFADKSFLRGPLSPQDAGRLAEILAKGNGVELIENHLNQLFKNIKEPKDLTLLNNWLNYLSQSAKDRISALELQLDSELVKEIMTNRLKREAEETRYDAILEFQRTFTPDGIRLFMLGDLVELDELDLNNPKITLPLEPAELANLFALGDFFSSDFANQAFKKEEDRYKVPCARIKTDEDDGKGKLTIPCASILRLGLVPSGKDHRLTPHLKT